MWRQYLFTVGCSVASAALTWWFVSKKSNRKKPIIYVPKYFASDEEQSLKVMEENAFATLVSVNYELNQMHTTLLPFVIDRKNKTLRGHVARYNQHANALSESGWQHLVIFNGPHCYISPTWYANWQPSGPEVPTWNYATVHCTIGATTILDGQDKYNLVKELSDIYENKAGSPIKFNLDDSVREEVDKQLKAIVAFELGIEQINGKFKMSQNRTEETRLSAIKHLNQKGGDMNTRVAAIMQQIM